MQHPDLGRLERDSGGGWVGTVTLSAFAGFDTRWRGPEMTGAEMASMLQQAQQTLEGRLAAFIGREGVAELNAAMDRAARMSAPAPTSETSAPSPPDEVPLAPGEFRLVVEGEEPTPEQVRAFTQFRQDEPGNCRRILQAIHRYYRDLRQQDPRWYGDYPGARSPEELRDLIRGETMHLSRFHYRGLAYLGFTFECAWEDEHGLGVLWHNGRVEEVGHYDAIFAVRRADNHEDEDTGQLTPHQQLLATVFAGADDEVERLRRQGADINDVGPHGVPPLCLAVMQGQVELVRRLLGLGANPRLRDSQGMTALDHALRAQEVLGPGDDSPFATIARLAGSRHLDTMNQMKSQVDEIVRILSEAMARDAGDGCRDGIGHDA